MNQSFATRRFRFGAGTRSSAKADFQPASQNFVTGRSADSRWYLS